MKKIYLSSESDPLDKDTIQRIGNRLFEPSLRECDMNSWMRGWFEFGIVSGVAISGLFMQYFDLGIYHHADMDLYSQTIVSLILCTGAICMGLLSAAIGFCWRISEKMELIRSVLDEPLIVIESNQHAPLNGVNIK